MHVHVYACTCLCSHIGACTYGGRLHYVEFSQIPTYPSFVVDEEYGVIYVCSIFVFHICTLLSHMKWWDENNFHIFIIFICVD